MTMKVRELFAAVVEEVMDMSGKEAKRMRLLCGLRQIDVWAGTGIPLARLSQAENGRLRLTQCERRLLGAFLLKKSCSLIEEDQQRVGQ